MLLSGFKCGRSCSVNNLKKQQHNPEACPTGLKVSVYSKFKNWEGKNVEDVQKKHTLTDDSMAMTSFSDLNLVHVFAG